MSLKTDERWMRRAIALGERGRGGVGANPIVGAVVVGHHRVVGEGWHARFGEPHAESVALARAGECAKGATLYVTLSPCTRTGKTPPCVRVIVASGVRRVVVACRDPLERDDGGFREMRRRGIAVVCEVLKGEARRSNEEFFVRLKSRRPFVTLKLATTLDGRIADHHFRSKWISSSGARAWTRRLRSGVDAVMVGVRTALLDDPRLTAPAGGNQPLKIVVDSRGRTRESAKLLRSGRVLIATTELCGRNREAELTARGAVVVRFKSRRDRVPLRAMMRHLFAMGLGSILCEGGSELAGALVSERLVDRVFMVISPRILGGAGALASLRGPDRSLERSLNLSRFKVSLLGSDALLEGRL